MQTFTGWEYLLIDLANHFGLDKLLFEERIDWAYAHLDKLEEMIPHGDLKERPLFQKTILSVQKARKGIEIGHLVGLDAICSGMQIMSAITGCVVGAESTGLINPNERADAYTKVTNKMGEILGVVQKLERKPVKTATMTSLYGSKAEPKKIWPEGSVELDAFYEALEATAPGAFRLLDELQMTWDSTALAHAWRLPDNHYAYIPVMDEVEKRIEVDELGHGSYTYYTKENMPKEFGVSNVANVIHSLDAYLLRTMERRCNYDAEQVEQAYEAVTTELIRRGMGIVTELEGELMRPIREAISTAKNLYEACKMADTTTIRWLTMDTATLLTTEHLEAIERMLHSMRQHKPFPIITIHDEFKCHPNNMNYLRRHYANVMAELADAEILTFIFRQLMGPGVTYQKMSLGLGDKIRQSNYAIC